VEYVAIMSERSGNRGPRVTSIYVHLRVCSIVQGLNFHEKLRPGIPMQRKKKRFTFKARRQEH
jgi:hypothetical protein